MGRTSKSIRKTNRTADDGNARSPASQKGFLPKEVYTVLRSYFTQVTRHPTKLQFEELVVTIQHIPGCEECQIRKLRAYFKQRRKTEARAHLAAEYKARNHAKPGTFTTPVSSEHVGKNSRTMRIGEITGVSPNPRTASQISTALAEQPQSPLQDLHLRSPSPSHNDAVPKTFMDLTKWLHEQNGRLMALGALEGLW
ncbi:hypothetical protein LXA43DRAFT_552236 [Ganoderma leucocontextum]|nr:hypothetical protein LXA43DRAFT_552236 [Ganoderma leucocontextum]